MGIKPYSINEVGSLNEAGSPLGMLRLMQLVSSGLPIGSFTYSQGLEWAVEAGWVTSQKELNAWLSDILKGSLTHLEVPIYARLYTAYQNSNFTAAATWVEYLLASRETAELKLEEQQRGRAFTRLLPELGLELDKKLEIQLRSTQLAGFAYAASQWKIEPIAAIQAYIWSWIENMSLAGVKLIPLGQTAGQQIIFELSGEVEPAVNQGFALSDDDIGFSCSAQAIASSLHERQYTRLYRS